MDDDAEKKLESRNCSGQMALGFMIISGFFIALFIVLVKGTPSGDGGVLNVLLGMLGSGFAGVIAYYFGSSLGSRNKEATLNSAMKTMTPPAASPLVAGGDKPVVNVVQSNSTPA